MNKFSVLFVGVDGVEHHGHCDVTEDTYENLAGGDTLLAFGATGQLYGYHDASPEQVIMTPRVAYVLLSVGEPGAPAVIVPADPSGDVTRLAAVSDLFFNYDHPARDALMSAHNGASKRIADVGVEQYREAVAKDAADFCNTFAIATGITLNVDDVVSDFLERE